MLYKINEILNILAAFQFFLFAAFLLSVQKGNRSAHRLLAAFLVGKGIRIVDLVLNGHWSYFYERCPHVFFIGWPFSLFYMPLLFWYTRAVMDRDFRWSWRKSVTMIPFAVACILSIFAYHIHGADAKRMLLTRPLFPQAFWNGFELVYWSQVFGYLAASAIALRAHRRRLKDYFSTLEKINLSWMSTVLAGFLGVYVLAFASSMAWRFQGRGFASLELALSASFLAFAVILTLKGLAQPEAFGGLDETAKSKSLSLDKSLQEKYLERLQEVMHQEKPYRDPMLTLDGLAEKLEVPPRHLSFVINNALNKNFFDLVNGYRIEEAKRILGEQSEKARTVLDVLYEVGFNSKSVFNTAFKKYTGITPREFKRMSAN